MRRANRRGVRGNNTVLPAANALVCEARPTCQSWQKKTAPLAFTASTMGFQAATCSSVKMPGVLGSLDSTLKPLHHCVGYAQAVTCRPRKMEASRSSTAEVVTHGVTCVNMAVHVPLKLYWEQPARLCSPEAAAGRACALAQHDAARPGSLRVVLDGCRLRHGANCPCPGQWRIADAVDQLKRTQLDRLEQRLVLTDIC